ncbi:hypothetical protein Q3G72_015166 [Acer saccharum]|nr:hypothetical protein Q3G72_015166 [Acer saccharum]
MKVSINLVFRGISFHVVAVAVRKEQENAFIATVPTENVANTCSSQAIDASATDDYHNKLRSHVAIGLPKISKGKDDAVVDGFADGVVGKATENVKGHATVAIGGKDNEKSTNWVPSITKGKVGAIDDDYHKKLHFQSAIGQPKVLHSTKKHGIKDNKQAPHANKKEDTALPKAIKNVKGDIFVDHANAANKKEDTTLLETIENVKSDAIVDRADARVNIRSRRSLITKWTINRSYLPTKRMIGSYWVLGRVKMMFLLLELLLGLLERPHKIQKVMHIATTGKDNEKSASGVPLITEGDAGATDDDYHKKLRSHLATKCER